jgi:uncharacterized protein
LVNIRWIAGVAGSLVLFVGVAALAADFQVPPRPQTEVVDDAGALSASASAALESELESFESKTGHHVVVYIGQTTGNVPLETWTAETATTWKVGQKGKDDGAILFVFMKDHKVRIEVGYGLESTLTDAASSQIINDTIVPKMKSGDTNAAITDGVAAILTTIQPNYAALQSPASADDGSGNDGATWVGLGFVIFVLLLGIFIALQIITSLRYGYLIRKEGAAAAAADMRKSWLRMFWTAGIASGAAGASSGGHYYGGGGFSGGGGGFSGGSFGGGFGGGGASGGW